MNKAEAMKNLTKLSYKNKVDQLLENIYLNIETMAKETKSKLDVYIPISQIQEKDIEKIILILKGDGFQVSYPAGGRNYGTEILMGIHW